MQFSSKLTMLIFLGGIASLAWSQPNDQFREAFDACIDETGVERPVRGTPPSDESRAKLDACLKEKGFTPPQKGERHKGQRRPGRQGPEDASLIEVQQ